MKFNITNQRNQQQHTIEWHDERVKQIRKAIVDVNSPIAVTLTAAHRLVPGKHTKKTNPFEGWKTFAYNGIIGCDYASAVKNLLKATLSRSPSLAVDVREAFEVEADEWTAKDNKWGNHYQDSPHILEQHGKLYVQLLTWNQHGSLFRAFTNEAGDQVSVDSISQHLLSSQLKSSEACIKLNSGERWKFTVPFKTRRITLDYIVNAKGLKSPEFDFTEAVPEPASV